MKILAVFATSVCLAACATLKSIQDSPGAQAAETAGISIAGTLATGDPAFSYLAPIAVNGLTALADGSNPTAVTGSNVAADVQLITSTIAAAIPTSTGKTVAAQIATAYTQAMATPGTPATAAGANAVISAIASGLTTGAGAAVATSFTREPSPFVILTGSEKSAPAISREVRAGIVLRSILRQRPSLIESMSPAQLHCLAAYDVWLYKRYGSGSVKL